MIELIKNKDEWKSLLDLIENSDFYFTYDYHHLSKNEDEEPVLLNYSEGDSSLILPLLLRDIDKSGYRDATSVYGYAGPLVIHMSENFNLENFQKRLHSFFIENKIVAVFSRLHPYMNHQEDLLNGLGEVATLGKVVCIDLTDDIENQRAKFNRRLKTYLNKSRRSCSIIKALKEEHLDAFIDLYHDNMRRVDADESYFFSNDYYRQILSSKDYKSELSLCVINDTKEIIGASMFLKKGEIVQYHLSGLNVDYSDLNPIKLIIDDMRIKSTMEGYKYFNLGGGKGSEEDSLFRFKSGFSKDFRDFKVWKYIVNNQIYDKLVMDNFGDKAIVENIEFFPAYRSRMTTNKLEEIE